MSHTVRLSPGDPSQFVPIQFPRDSLEAQRGGLILTPIPPAQSAGTGTAQGGFRDETISHTKSLADTNIFKKVTQQAMTTGRSLSVNYMSPNGFESILQTNLKKETYGESGTLTLNREKEQQIQNESCFLKP